MANIKDRYKGSHNTANLRTNIYERRVLADTTPGTLRNKTLTSALYKWHYDNGLFDSIKFLWAGDAGIRLDASAVKRVTKAYSMEQYNDIIPRRNLLTYTEEFDNIIGWTQSGVTVSANQTANPFGAINADKIIPVAAATSFKELQQNINAVIGTDYSYSIYVKDAGYRYCQIIGSSTPFGTFSVNYDLQTGIETSFSQSNSTILSRGIQDVGGGWYRLNLSIRCITTSAGRIALNIIPASNSGRGVNWASDGVSGQYWWGAQLEIGSSSTAYQRVIDAESWVGKINDATQGTFTNQPYLSGHIAPNETYCLKNVNGGAAYMTHPTISFAVGEKWSFTLCINFNGNSTAAGLYHATSSTSNLIGFKRSSVYQFFYGDSDSNRSSFGSTLSMLGKNTIFTFVHDGSILTAYQNGSSVGTLSGYSSKFSFQTIHNIVSENVFGQFHTHQINNVALTAAQVQSLYNTIKGFIPDIPSVVIGGQTWATSNLEMVATPMGNLIANVTDNTAWATSTTLYTNAYNAATGTEEQKVYAGVKAAAMWCHYGNVADNGAIYGKLYNWYAAKLLQMDIDYYNTANPTTPWGWRVPTSTDFNTLATYLGGASVAGGKMKVAGTTYWAAGNIGDNSSGFSALGGGARSNIDGTSSSLLSIYRSWTTTEVDSSNSYRVGLNSGDSILSNTQVDKRYGFSIRLIKN